MDNWRIIELRRRVESDPASIAFAQLAEEYRRTGAYEEAVRVCREGLDRHSTYLSARVTLGRALLELGEYDEAQKELEQTLQSAPENLAALRALAETHLRRGNLLEALGQYQAALAISRHDPELDEAVLDLKRQLGQAASSDTHPSGASAAPGTGGDVQPPPRLEPASEPRIIPLEALSPELEAAADEFTRALQALDSLTLGLPETPQERDLENAADTRASAAAVEESAVLAPSHAEESERRADEAMVGELESWLDAILRDRVERARRRDGSGSTDSSDLSLQS